jgi:hypothetical protein
MNKYDELIETLKQEYRSSFANPDWNQVGTWSSYVPKDIQKVWQEIPYAYQLLIYHTAFQAYTKSH